MAVLKYTDSGKAVELGDVAETRFHDKLVVIEIRAEDGFITVQNVADQEDEYSVEANSIGAEWVES